MAGTFIDVEVDAAVAADPEQARKLAEVCPVDIFKAGPAGVEIVQENLDECVLCELCIRAAPPGNGDRAQAVLGRVATSGLMFGGRMRKLAAALTGRPLRRLAVLVILTLVAGHRLPRPG